MNLCMFSGRITRDCDTRYTQSGKPVSNFCIAVDTGFGEYKRTEFINCVLWNREGIGNYLTKGKAVTISGEYAESKYTDKDGNERRKVEIKVDQIEFQQGNPREGDGGVQDRHHRDNGGQQTRQQGGQRGGNNGSRGRQDEDLGPCFPSEGSDTDSVPF